MKSITKLNGPFTTKSVMTEGLQGLVTNLRILRKHNLTRLTALNM